MGACHRGPTSAPYYRANLLLFLLRRGIVAAADAARAVCRGFRSRCSPSLVPSQRSAARRARFGHCLVTSNLLARSLALSLSRSQCSHSASLLDSLLDLNRQSLVADVHSLFRELGDA